MSKSINQVVKEIESQSKKGVVILVQEKAGKAVRGCLANGVNRKLALEVILRTMIADLKYTTIEIEQELHKIELYLQINESIKK